VKKERENTIIEIGHKRKCYCATHVHRYDTIRYDRRD